MVLRQWWRNKTVKSLRCYITHLWRVSKKLAHWSMLTPFHGWNRLRSYSWEHSAKWYILAHSLSRPININESVFSTTKNKCFILFNICTWGIQHRSSIRHYIKNVLSLSEKMIEDYNINKTYFIAKMYLFEHTFR